MNTRRSNLLSLVLILATVGAACDPEPAPLQPVVTLNLEQCTPTWRTLFAPEAMRPSPSDLRAQGDRLYFSVPWGPEAAVRAVPTAGGAVTTVRNEVDRRFWIEGEDIVFVTDEGLFRSPVGGGPVEPIPGGKRFEPPRTTVASGWALERDALFWAEHVPGPDLAIESVAIWRGLRDGSGEMSLGALPAKEWVQEIVPTGDQLIVTAKNRGLVWALPKTGGAAKQMTWVDGSAAVIGIAEQEQVFYRRIAAGEGAPRDLTSLVGRARIDGTAVGPAWRTTWPITPTAAWSDGAGGMYVATMETADRGVPHLAMWSVNAAGQGTRLACDPQVDSTIETAVATREGIYMLVRQVDRWQIVGVTAPVRAP